MAEGGLLGPATDLVDHGIGQPDGMKVIDDGGGVAKWGRHGAGIAAPGIQRHCADLG
jgi:hypothetical protein